MKKRMISFLLTGAMLAATVCGCGKQEPQTASQDTATQEDAGAQEKEPEKAIPEAEDAQETDTGESSGLVPGEFPISEEPITIRIMVPVSASQAKPLAELDMIKEYEEKTNVHVEWEEVSMEAYAEKYKLTLASGDLPDAFGPSFAYDPSVIYKYAQEGMIVPLDEYIQSSTVNIKKWMNEYDEFRALSTYPDGHIYALPSIDENQNIRVDNLLYINQSFLDKLNMEMPKTLDELGDYLRSVTTRDLNGDGRNEYGLSFEALQNAPSKYTYLFGLFGVAWDTKSYMNSRQGTTELEFAPTMEETRKALEYFHGWYEEGLLDPENFTQNGTQLKAKAKTEGVGASVVFWYLDLNDGDETQNEYRVMPLPEGPEKNQVWRRNGMIPGYSANQFFITSANEHPQETLAFIDYWMDNSDNALINRFGPQGYSWDYLENGKWTELANIPTGEPRTMENSTLYCTWGTGIPYWCFGDFWSQKEITANTALERQGALNGSYMEYATPGLPELVYEEAENREALNIKTDLFKYVDSQIAQFITNGVTDESWNAFVKKCQDLQSGRWAELYQKYYDLMMAD